MRACARARAGPRLGAESYGEPQAAVEEEDEGDGTDRGDGARSLKKTKQRKERMQASRP